MGQCRPRREQTASYHPKRGKPLTIPLATPLREHILNHLSANDVPDAPVHPRAFATLKKDKRVRHLSAQFGDLLAAAGGSYLNNRINEFQIEKEKND
jgi:hypothetical protein